MHNFWRPKIDKKMINSSTKCLISLKIAILTPHIIPRPLVNVWLIFDLQKYVNWLCVFLKSVHAFKEHTSFVWIYSQLQIHTMLYVDDIQLQIQVRPPMSWLFHRRIVHGKKLFTYGFDLNLHNMKYKMMSSGRFGHNLKSFQSMSTRSWVIGNIMESMRYELISKTASDNILLVYLNMN